MTRTPPPPHPLFGPPVAMAHRTAAVQDTRAAAPAAFPTRGAARGFLHQIILPPSMNWGFISVGKNASSSVLNLLFRAEFAVDMGVSVTPESDINPAAAIHMLADNRVFARALHRGLSLPDLLGARGPKERICVTRDPMARIVSAFRYFCQSDTLHSRWFAGDRFRINAALGFDWAHHPGTPEGLRRFLRYIAQEVDQVGTDNVNGHWRPQVDFIKPDAFAPTLTGRMDDMEVFYRALSARIGFALDGPAPWENRQNTEADPLLSDAPAQTLCQQIYASDYQAFGY